jgi:lysophospholipase L1-like esterase
MTVPADSPLIQWHGRVVKPGDGSVHADWLGSGARISWSGSYLKATYAVPSPKAAPFKSASWSFNENYYVPNGHLWVTPGAGINGTVDVVVGINGLETVTSLNSPPQYFAANGGPAVITAISTDGTINSPPPQWTRSIEIIGDSITAATNIHAHPPCADEGIQCDYSVSYSGLLQANFSANVSTIAVGGKGLIRNCCDNGEKMPDYFLQTLYSDSSLRYTFAETGFVPDAVIINLGTNDFHGSNGTDPVFNAQFASAYVGFMQNITRWYAAPNITFFAVVGPMTTAMEPAVLMALANATAQGIRAQLINASGIYCDGCAGHPGVQGHYFMFQAAQRVIAATMGWSS